MKTLRVLALLVASLFLAASPLFADTKIIAIPAPASTPGNTTPVYAGAITGNATLSAATGNEVAFRLNYTTNKATSGNDTGLVINMTDTASPGTSLPLDLQKGGVSYFRVNDSGYATFAMAELTNVYVAGAISRVSLINPVVIQGNGGAAYTGTAASTVAQIASTATVNQKTAGQQTILAVTPTYNQTSGTAANTDLLISRIETALGSGAQKFLSLQAGAAGTTEIYFVNNKGIRGGAMGTAVASATTIVPTGPYFHVTGTTNVVNITAPQECTAGCEITIIPDGVFATTAAGNIALASTAVVSKALRMVYDAATAKWYPSY